MMNRGLMKRQMFAMGGPVRMENGGIASLDENPNFRPDASELEMRAMAQFLSGTEGVSPNAMFERISGLSDFERIERNDASPRRDNQKLTYDSFDQLSKSEKDLVEEAKEKMRGIPRDTFDQLISRRSKQGFREKSFVESQPEGMALASGAAFFDLTGDGQMLIR